MDFAYYTDWSVRAAVDLVNSVGSITGREYLGTSALLRKFLIDHHIRPPRSISPSDVDEVHELRSQLRAVFHSENEDQRVRLLNELLLDAGMIPQVTNHDGNWHFHYVPDDAPLARRVSAITGMGLATVICNYGNERLGVCSADRCRDVFVDASRNSSKRYCGENCATRMSVAAYRKRRKQKSEVT